MKLKISKTLKGLPTCDYRELIPLQGNLKDLSESNYNKLKKSLTEFGFIVPLFIWKHEGKNYIIDAHQRHRVLMKEQAQPFLLPYVEIEADSEKEAKKRLLVISSQYGKITQEGFDEFAFDIEDYWKFETVNFDALQFYDISVGSDGFSLPSGDKAPFQQMTFTLADAQVEIIKQALKDVKIQDGTQYGNENSNGNALHQIVLEWAGQRK